jgi:hypothetical protein
MEIIKKKCRDNSNANLVNSKKTKKKRGKRLMRHTEKRPLNLREALWKVIKGEDYRDPQ